MFKTIFGKLVVIFVLILITALSVTGVMLNYFLGSYVTEEKANALENSCDIIDWSLNIYSQNPKNPVAKAILDYTLQQNGANTNSYIWIVDQNGHILESNFSPSVINTLKDDSGYITLPEEGYRKIMSSPGTLREIGNFYGFFNNPVFGKYSNVDWLTVEKSNKYTVANGSGTMLAIYLSTPVPEVNKARFNVFGYFLISAGVAVLISVILIYIFSLRMTRPLKQIRDAARVIAGGEFTKRLDIKSKDEIGELAGTFNQMAVALQNLEEMRRGFIANVSHELRTPMTSIRGFIEGILDGTITAERQGYYLNIVRDETNRLNRLVNDLLDLARMEAGEMVLNLQPVNINELVRKCVIKLESLIVGKGINIEADFEEEDLYADADADAIERVLYNLVHNAIKFTHENGKIEITTKVQRNKIVLSVEDNGTGIGEDELNMIWDRFYKSDKSRGRDKTGTGLGLAIVKNIINEHNQQIWVESEIGKGTRFTFTLNKTGGMEEADEL